MTTPKTRREQEFEAFKKAWEEYPSQDNEGFVPDRGGFKCGWFAAVDWMNEKTRESMIPRSEADRLVREAVESERERVLKLVGNWTGCKYCSTGETFTEILNPPTEERGT